VWEVDFPNSRLWPYVHDINVYYCPNDTRPVKGRIDPNYAYGFGPLASYGMNALMGDEYIADDKIVDVSSSTQSQPYLMTKLTQIRHPESTFVFIEVGPNYLAGSPRFDLPILNTVSGIGAGAGSGSPYHRRGHFAEGNTISFADGHAIFWNYAVPIDMSATYSWNQNDKIDQRQILAWCGQHVSPGVLAGATP